MCLKTETQPFGSIKGFKENAQTSFIENGELIMLNKLQVLLGISFLLVGGIVAANAQIDGSSAIKFEVAHPFVVDGETLPAGKYSISSIASQGGSNGVLKIQSIDGKEAMLFSTLKKVRSAAAAKTELVFEQVGGEYFLTEIRVKGDEDAVVVDSRELNTRVSDDAAEN
jgi:hypothetical protein